MGSRWTVPVFPCPGACRRGCPRCGLWDNATGEAVLADFSGKQLSPIGGRKPWFQTTTGDGWLPLEPHSNGDGTIPDPSSMHDTASGLVYDPRMENLGANRRISEEAADHKHEQGHEHAPPGPARRDVLRAAVGASLAGLGIAGAAAAEAARAAVSEDKARPQTSGAKITPRFPVVDIHNHAYWLGHNPRKMVENMDRNGIARTWLLSWEVPDDEIAPEYFASLNPLGVGIPFADVVRQCEMFPDRFLPGYAIDPRRPYAREKLRSAVAIHGVRVYGELKLRASYDDPDFMAMFRLSGDLGLPVIFHLDVVLPRGSVQTTRQWWYGGHIDNVERALKECPRTAFLGHSPGFWREISGDAEEEPSAYPKGRPVKPGGKIIKLLDKYPNMNCDLSAGSGLTALSRDLELTRKFLIDYQDRCFFGRDDVDSKLYELLMSLSLPDDVLRKILGGNAYRLVPVS